MYTDMYTSLCVYNFVYKMTIQLHFYNSSAWDIDRMAKVR